MFIVCSFFCFCFWFVFLFCYGVFFKTIFPSVCLPLLLLWCCHAVCLPTVVMRSFRVVSACLSTWLDLFRQVMEWSKDNWRTTSTLYFGNRQQKHTHTNAHRTAQHSTDSRHTHAPTHTHTHSRTQVRTHAHTHTHTRTERERENSNSKTSCFTRIGERERERE